MQQYTLGIYEKAMPPELSWNERLDIAKNSNYDFLEISIDESDARLNRLYDNSRLEIKNAIANQGFPIDTMCLSGHRKYPLGDSEKETRIKSLDIMKRAIDLAHYLGVRIIQLAGYDTYYGEHTQQTQDYFEENLAIATKMASAAGVLMGFETMETQFMDTVGKAMQYVNKINSPYLGVYPDCGNLTNASKLYHIDPISDFMLGAGKILAMHVKETVPGVYREIEFGTGHVDFKSFIDVALSLGVNKFVAEFWYTGSKTWQTDVANANKFARAIIDHSCR